LDALRAQLQEYFQGRRREFTVPLNSVGSEFQQRVWAALCEIPYGETWSYLQLALRIGDALATRAVGYANGANPIAIVIPCHRVINADGGEGGYGGGLWRKRILLDLERGQGTLAL
jgi:O-6-methylguanine DNA methyltransferase